MKESLSLGPVPCNESCQQVGTANYDPIAARYECRRFVREIVRQHGNPPEGVRLRITSNPHDYGTYLDVVVEFDPNNETAVDWAYTVENDLPADWSEETREENEKFDGTEGQDRRSYSDTQDRKSYTIDPEWEAED